MSTSWREPAAPAPMVALRCKSCQKLLGKSDGRGRLEVVCSRCGVHNTFRTR